jgi:hypothetical protein
MLVTPGVTWPIRPRLARVSCAYLCTEYLDSEGRGADGRRPARRA